jgi:transcriptional regulator with XRE-family HTH domain
MTWLMNSSSRPKIEITTDLMRSVLYAAKRAGLNQKELALKIGVEPSRISRWLDGTGEPSATQIRRIADITATNVDDLTSCVAEPATVEIDTLAPDERALLAFARAIDGGPSRAISLLARAVSLGMEFKPMNPPPGSVSQPNAGKVG